MGTRADFYVGRGENAEWLGSIAWDGYPGGITLTSAEKEIRLGIETSKRGDWPKGHHLFDAQADAEFRERVGRFFANREDVTLPEHGWPWPWETSHTTDYSYAFDGGRVYASCFGHAWFDPRQEEPEHDDDKPTVFPDMTTRTNVAPAGTNRSGVMVFTLPA